MAANKRSKKTAKKKTAKKNRSAGGRPPALSIADKQSMLKPGDDFAPLAARFIETWKQHSRTVRSPDTTVARLGALLRKAEKAAAKERDLERKLVERLRPLSDARLRAGHELMNATLNVWDIVKALSDERPELEESFSFFRDALTRLPKRKKDE